MKTLVVGDLHGRFDVAEMAVQLALKGNECQKTVFVGDYLDSFKLPPEDQVRTLLSVLAGIESGKVEALLGNHEYSYLNSGLERCGGFNAVTDNLVAAVGHSRIKEKFLDYTYVGEYLVTHAGVSQVLLDDLDLNITEYLDEGMFHQVGRYRGGWDACGGLRWCDFNAEFEPVEGVAQIFGHTHYQDFGDFKTRGLGNKMNYNIDCIPATPLGLAGEDPEIAYGLMVDEETGGVQRYGIC